MIASKPVSRGNRYARGAKLGRVFCVVLIGFSVLVLGAYWGSRIDANKALEEATLQEMERQANALTAAVSEQTRGAIYNLDLTMLHLAHLYSMEKRLTEFDVQSVKASTPDGLVRRVTLIGKDGRAKVTFPVGGAGVDLSDRQHFLVHSTGQHAGLFIGRPIRSRVEEKWVIPLSRRLVDEHGRFAGVIAVMTNPEYFSGIYGRLASGRDDVITLVLGDGAFLSRSQNLMEHLGKTVRTDRPFIGKDAPESGVFRSISTLEPVDRVFAFRRLSEWPLVTVIGLGVAEALAPVRASQRREQRAALGGSVLVLVLVAGICIVIMRLERSLLQVRESDDRRAMAFAGANELAWEWDLSSGLVRFFGDCRPFFGKGEEEQSVQLESWTARIHPDDRETIRRQTKDFVQGSAGGLEVSYRFCFADGVYRWVLVRGAPVAIGPDGRVSRSLGVLMDIDADRKAQIESAQTKEVYQRLIESAGEGIFVVNREGVIQLFNPAAERLLGWSALEVLGREAHLLFHGTVDSGETAPVGECPVRSTLSDSHSRRGVRELYRHKDGRSIPVEISVAPITLDGVTDGAVVLIVDVSRQLAYEAELERLARTDGLTGVWNRRYFVEQFLREMKRVERDSDRLFLSILMVDLDHFKEVNDQYGHAAGDAVLVSLAAHFRAQLRQVDIIGRLGGEEFGVGLPGIGFDEARVVAERLRAGLDQLDIVVGEMHIHCTASIGVALWNGEESFDAVLGRADNALYQAKAIGRNKVVG